MTMYIFLNKQCHTDYVKNMTETVCTRKRMYVYYNNRYLYLYRHKLTYKYIINKLKYVEFVKLLI